MFLVNEIDDDDDDRDEEENASIAFGQRPIRFTKTTILTQNSVTQQHHPYRPHPPQSTKFRRTGAHFK